MLGRIARLPAALYDILHGDHGRVPQRWVGWDGRVDGQPEKHDDVARLRLRSLERFLSRLPLSFVGLERALQPCADFLDLWLHRGV